MPWRDSSTLRDTVRSPREVWAPAAASGHASPRAWNSLSQQAPRCPRRPAPSGAALCALRVLSLLDPRAWPAAPPPGSQLLPRLPRVPVPTSSSPAPARSRARSPRPALVPPRAAATANKIRGRVRRFKRRLLREAGREIRRCGQNPAGGCDPCRAVRCGERAGVGARGGAALRQRRGG